MATAIQSAEKRHVNLTLNVTLVEQARAYSSNLSVTVEELLQQFVQAQYRNRQTHEQQAAATAAEWNAFHAKAGSFADEHSTL